MYQTNRNFRTEQTLLTAGDAPRGTKPGRAQCVGDASSQSTRAPALTLDPTAETDLPGEEEEGHPGPRGS